VLVLSRRVGEEIRIGDNIVIKVQGISGGRVSLAFEAPLDVKIDRAEIPKDQDSRDRFFKEVKLRTR